MLGVSSRGEKLVQEPWAGDAEALPCHKGLELASVYVPHT